MRESHGELHAAADLADPHPAQRLDLTRHRLARRAPVTQFPVVAVAERPDEHAVSGETHGVVQSTRHLRDVRNA